MSAFLEARDVTKIFGTGHTQTRALANFSLRIDDAAPTIIAIAGESGSGKSTLGRLLLGFTRPTSGQILYRGEDLWQLGRGQRTAFRREVQAIFQDPFAAYNPTFRVDHLLHEPLRNFRLAASRADARNQIERAFATVGLNSNEILGRYPHQLSGGQRQRVIIARALLLRPRLIIADEPVSMVDASLRATILESLLALYRDFGISFLYITHDLTTAYQISEQIVVLYQGNVVESGPAKAVIRDPQHPYTQLLVRSIPSPDPDRRWDEQAEVGGETVGGLVRQGCAFAPRCPFVMPMCREQAPPLYRVGPAAVACYLHRDAPVIAPDRLGELVEAGDRPHPPTPCLPPKPPSTGGRGRSQF